MLLGYSSRKIGKLRKFLCVKFSLFLMRIYDRFRECTGVKESTDKIMNKIKENEEKVSYIDEKIPVIATGIQELQEKNKALQQNVFNLLQELKKVDNYARNNDCESIIMLLSKYEFQQKMEN